MTPPPDETGNGPVTSSSGSGALVEVVDVEVEEVDVVGADGSTTEDAVVTEGMGMSGADVVEAG